MRYSRRSIGYCWSIIHNNRAAKSAVPVTNCRFNWKTGRDNPFVTFWTRLVLPKRRGLISIRWFSLASISLTFSCSATLSVKVFTVYNCTEFKWIIHIATFFNATFFANIRNIFEFILKDWLKWRNTYLSVFLLLIPFFIQSLSWLKHFSLAAIITWYCKKWRIWNHCICSYNCIYL